MEKKIDTIYEAPELKLLDKTLIFCVEGEEGEEGEEGKTEGDSNYGDNEDFA